VVNDLKDLMRANVAAPPPDELDLHDLVGAGQRRVRNRRRAATGGAALATAAVLAVGVVALPDGGGRAEPASQPPAPDAPTLTLADAAPAVEGQDYRELMSYTNENLNADNGQYLDGVTDDGLVLFRDGPRAEQLRPRFALMDPATGEKDWLPRLEGVGQTQTWPAALDTDQLVLLGLDGGVRGDVTAFVFDRDAREWRTLQWPGLPKTDFPVAHLGPDGRLYVLVAATRPGPPEGGWPMGLDGEAEDADAEGETNHLWSVSLTDPTDVRDEGMTVGDIAFTDDALVWTDSSGGDAGMVHVRDLATGTETSFDPHTGDRCNLLSFGATGDRIMMSQYCGTYEDGRDDRVQILSTDGEQVATIQDDGIDGWLPAGSNVVNVTVYNEDAGGTYVYDLETDRFLRVSDGVSSWGLGGPTGAPRQFMWHTPVNQRNGATQHIGELLD
jgi:hypothetical protein